MLLSVIPGLAGISISAFIFGQGVPVFVYILPIIWVILFLISLKRLRLGLMGGIVWGVMNLFISIIPVMMGVENPIAKALDIPICPFALLGMILSLAVIYFCVSAYEEV